MLKDLISLANALGENGLRAEADYLDKIIVFLSDHGFEAIEQLGY